MLLSRRSAALGMMSGAAAILPAARAAAQVPPAAPPAPNEEQPTQVDAAKDPYSHLLAPVVINGQGPFQFLLDTGANTSCISGALAEKLMLAPGEPAPVHTAVGVRTRPQVLIDKLSVGSRTRHRVKAAALPALGPEVDGVLGVDWLGGQRLVLDFKRKNLEITRSRWETSGPNRVVVSARRRLGQLTIVDADLSGRRISAMIDSGAQSTICNTPLRKLVEEIEKRRPPASEHQVVHLETLAGEPFRGEMFYLPFLRLGGLTLGNVPTVYADTHIFELWGLKDKPALVLGMDLLRQFDLVALDYGRSEVRFDIA